MAYNPYVKHGHSSIWAHPGYDHHCDLNSLLKTDQSAATVEC